jgi:hypothetical protein
MPVLASVATAAAAAVAVVVGVVLRAAQHKTFCLIDDTSLYLRK